jgi:hypothetical protein
VPSVAVAVKSSCSKLHFIAKPDIARAHQLLRSLFYLVERFDKWGVRGQFPEETENFQKVFQPYPVFHPVDTEGGVPRLKRPEREAGHSSPSSSAVKTFAGLCSQFPVRFPNVMLINGLIVPVITW